MSSVSEAPSAKTRSLVADALGGLEPLAAARTLQRVMADILADLDEGDKAEIIMGLAGEPGEDKVSSMVHL